MTNAEIDIAGEALIDLLKAAAPFYPEIRPSIPILRAVILYGTHALKAGIAAGMIVPDGAGGYVPAHGQSYYDPKTGEFTGRET